MNKENCSILKTVGVFNDSFPPIMDGVSLVTQNYAYSLHEMEVPVCVVTPKFPNFQDAEPYPVLRYSSISVFMRKPYRLGLPNLDLNIYRKLNHINFGLIHSHSPFSTGSLALDIAKRKHIRLIATFHSKFKEDFERIFGNEYVVDFMLKKAIKFFQYADEVWIPQESVLETLREYGYKGKVEVVDNGSDMVVDRPIEQIRKEARISLKIKPAERIFLFVGQHIWEKNTKLIIEALAILRKENYKMFFIGEGYASDGMKELVKKMGLQNKILFVGLIKDRDLLKKYYAASDLFLFPSMYDNAPLVVREAATLHTPSVMVENSTAADIIKDNYNGFLCKNTKESLSERISEIIADPEKMKEVGDHAACSISRSWRDIMEEVVDRYVRLIKRTR